MSVAQDFLTEAKRWSERAEENYAKADTYRDDYCRRTMLDLGRSAEQYAERAALLALKATEPVEDMQSKSGLHPYHAALFFILREQRNGSRPSRQQRAAVELGDIDSICQWPIVRCLAHAFGKSNRQVARDLVDTDRALEDNPAP